MCRSSSSPVFLYVFVFVFVSLIERPDGKMFRKCRVLICQPLSGHYRWQQLGPGFQQYPPTLYSGQHGNIHLSYILVNMALSTYPIFCSTWHYPPILYSGQHGTILLPYIFVNMALSTYLLFWSTWHDPPFLS